MEPPDNDPIMIQVPAGMLIVHAGESVWCHQHERLLVPKGGLLSPFVIVGHLEDCCREVIEESLRKLVNPAG